MRKYGSAPKDFGYFVNPNPEMMFWLYCPISLAGSNNVVIPHNLRDYKYMVEKALAYDTDWRDRYVYLTAKTLYVTPQCMGNRPGWHSDGFGTNDINYIWSDECPTEFLESERGFNLSEDHMISMEEMKAHAGSGGCVIKTYQKGHILRLDPCVIHRVPHVSTNGFSGVRSFAKVTISDSKFDLAGNSVNYDLAPNWTYSPRRKERNLECSGNA